MRKQERGITLIALVVTIVVLIILAVISISTLNGENGIINQANNAKDSTQYANWEELIEIAIVNAESKHNSANIDDVIDELINSGVISNKDQVDKITGTITTNEPSYIIEDKLNDYINFDILFENLEWENQLASIEISTKMDCEIEYKINDESTWNKIENGGIIQNLENGDNIIGRLVNGGEILNTETYEVKDIIPPQIKEFSAKKVVNNETKESNVGRAISGNPVNITLDAEDNETGLNTAIITLKNSQNNNITKELNLKDGSVTFPYTLTLNMTSNDNDMTVTIEITDNAGNKAEKTVQVE